MQFLFLALLIVGLVVTACSKDSDDAPQLAEARSEPPKLPTGSDEVVQLKGTMSFWIHEEATGCYGILKVGRQDVQLWSSSKKCAGVKYSDDQSTRLKVTYKPENQYGPGMTYTVVGF